MSIITLRTYKSKYVVQKFIFSTICTLFSPQRCSRLDAAFVLTLLPPWRCFRLHPAPALSRWYHQRRRYCCRHAAAVTLLPPPPSSLLLPSRCCHQRCCSFNESNVRSRTCHPLSSTNVTVSTITVVERLLTLLPPSHSYNVLVAAPANLVVERMLSLLPP